MSNQITIDAAGKSLGRVASEAAVVLRGKDSPSFERNTAPKNKVTIENASKMLITEKKRQTKNYQHYTGHPGGQRDQSMAEVIAKKGYEEVLRKAVFGMIPSTRLRPGIMKNLTITA